MRRIEVRRADEQDGAFLLDMLYDALFLPPGRNACPRSVLEHPAVARYAADFPSHRGDLGFIATASGDRVGAAWARLLTGDNRGFGHVDDDTPELTIAVRHDQRNRGIGRTLLRTLIAASPRLSLSVDGRNAAVRLYTSLGFVVVGHLGNSFTMLRAPGWPAGSEAPGRP